MENVDQDPMRINLRMEGAKDPDGVIRSYTWYYYTSSDEQPQGFRITTKPETSFTLPKINGRYHFSVVLEDANGLRIDTRDISENKFSTPDLLVNQNISTPIIEFKASTTDAKYGDPVELTVTAKNALGQDITKVVEYRWDVDGDGFYDIKTSENTLSYKYTVPGQYHPKVKATHRGLSTTKFLTVTVTNRLIPQAQVQVIGDKIVAYNTSTGIIQGVSWFADGVKISENKEYLVYTPTDGKFPKNIRLEISEGADKQSVTIPVERNPQNKVLVKKVGRPLIVLANENSTVATVGDDVIWSDPMKPLFFYLGESEGSIQYYVIDNDVDIDTDLSGGKNDDADNKGTASYRLGRPYSVPLGNKRVTIMKFRLLSNDGKELDSRQIRVTRSFMAQVTDANNITGVTPNKNTQTFNLSKEDKARLDRLTVLVKNITDETVKKELLRHVDQLGDIWYDRADRAETLLQFSRAVNDSDVINSDLKTRILEQINLIYTQGQQDAEEKDLARTMLADFLAKSPNKKEIFGNGTPEDPGLLGQIIDSPEYYEQNKKLVEKIYNEYVKFDTTLSDDAKAIIQEKLIFLAGTPPIEKPTTPEQPTVTDENTNTNFMATLKEKLSAFGASGNIILWVVVAVIGLFGMIFAVSKMAGSRHINEDISPANSTPTPSPAPEVKNTGTDHDESAPDWLKPTESPFGSEDVLSKEVSNQTTSEPTTPSWMQEHEEKAVVATTTNTTTDHLEDVPDWLKDTHETPVPTTPPSWLTEETPDKKEEAPAPEPTEAIKPAEDESHADIPDWLKGAETPSTSNESEKETTTPIVAPEETTKEDSTIAPENAAPSIETPTAGDAHEDLPDWLKGAETPSEISESKTPEPNV